MTLESRSEKVTEVFITQLRRLERLRMIVTHSAASNQLPILQEIRVFDP